MGGNSQCSGIDLQARTVTPTLFEALFNTRKTFQGRLFSNSNEGEILAK
jgi:hypothetical protein